MSISRAEVEAMEDGDVILVVHYDAQEDVVFWCGYTNGHDGQGWTSERIEALEFHSYRAAMDERKVAKRWHPKMRISVMRDRTTTPKMKPILITSTAVPAIAAAITALTGTPHESALVDLLREASPYHPLLWDLARLQIDHDKEPVEHREVTAEMVREHACKAIAREQGAL